MLKYKGYSVDSVGGDYEQMKARAREDGYDLYAMDLNLGNPRSEDITPSIEIFTLVEERVEQGLAKFVGISGSEENVEKAKKIGIPAIHTGEDNNVLEAIFS
jgi:hypothetical protein